MRVAVYSILCMQITALLLTTDLFIISTDKNAFIAYFIPDIPSLSTSEIGCQPLQ